MRTLDRAITIDTRRPRFKSGQQQCLFSVTYAWTVISKLKEAGIYPLESMVKYFLTCASDFYYSIAFFILQVTIKEIIDYGLCCTVDKSNTGVLTRHLYLEPMS